jgi:hypothetical protein
VQIKVVLGIHNDAGEPYNITSIMGSVNSVADFKSFIHNLTHQVRLHTHCKAVLQVKQLSRQSNLAVGDLGQQGATASHEWYPWQNKGLPDCPNIASHRLAVPSAWVHLYYLQIGSFNPNSLQHRCLQISPVLAASCQ